MKQKLYCIIRFWKTGYYWVVLLITFTISTQNIFGRQRDNKVSIHEKRDGIYELKIAGLTMGIDAEHGARILSFRIDNKEILSSKAIHPENYGSTLWLSPQTWSWPPYPVLDNECYQVEMKKNTIRFTSSDDPISGYRITKTLSADQRNGAVLIKYVITNISDQDKSVAPWEVTRVTAGGISFFPIGTAGGFSKSNMVTSDINDLTWFTYKPELVTGHQKMFRNGSEGWLAHVNNGLIFVKQFPDIGIEQEAPNESEVELYANKDRTYIELENQGPYTTLRPSESVSWTVKWVLRKLPYSIPIEYGNLKLVDYVRMIIQCKK